MGKWVLMGLLVAAMMSDARPILAAPQQGSCFTDFLKCEYEAARENNFWWRTMKALDCELNLWGCLKDTLVG